VKLPLGHSADELRAAVCDALGINDTHLVSYSVLRQSLDARHKDRLCFVYMVDAEVLNEEQVLASRQNAAVSKAVPFAYQYPSQRAPLSSRPVIVGAGPAGLFAGLLLARSGQRPIMLERGKPLEERHRDVGRFFSEGVLDSDSNVQFGEGGAGTYSDGKLTTLIRDSRCRKVLEEMVSAGAPKEILYKNKPHVGTDRIRQVVRSLRHTIEQHGGEFRFQHKVTDLVIEQGRITAVTVNGISTIESDVVIFAIGNSSRDTFDMLHAAGVMMTPKPFSIGVRIEHPRQLIDRAQYGRYAGHPQLGAADYKMVHHCSNGHSAYTFCMCPGGVVIAAASEAGGVVTNGMSYYARNKENSNSALLVGVGPAEFGCAHPLAGVAYQRQWETKAFLLGGSTYHAPVQLVNDFLADRPSTAIGSVKPSYRPGVVPGDLRECLPDNVCQTLKEAIVAFSRKLNGFALPDAVLTGVETRSSCPVRIVRDNQYQSNIQGLHPAGEGAGYAGGIMSSAVDGIKVAEAVLKRGLATRSEAS